MQTGQPASPNEGKLGGPHIPASPGFPRHRLSNLSASSPAAPSCERCTQLMSCFAAWSSNSSCRMPLQCKVPYSLASILGHMLMQTHRTMQCFTSRHRTCFCHPSSCACPLLSDHTPVSAWWRRLLPGAAWRGGSQSATISHQKACKKQS